MNSPLSSQDAWTQLLVSEGISTWKDALEYVKKIPYGRNTNRDDFSLVVKENKGTCSSKHAFLKEIANRNGITDVDLIIGIYKMNEKNTQIGYILSDNQLKYLPEAHCYLRQKNKTIDVTNIHSEFEKLKNDVLVEISIQPNQVIEEKISIHQDFIKKWINDQKIALTFDQIWSIREQCIKQLSL